MTASEIKLKAKEQLMGKKKDAALVILLYAIVVGVINACINKIFPAKVSTDGIFTITEPNPVASIINYAITIFFGLGLANYFMKLARGEDAAFDDLFKKGNLFFKALITGILTGVLCGLGCVLLIIPGIILALAYSMITYIYIDNPDIGIVEVMTKSREMMKGHKSDFFFLMLSFIGWMILGLFTLGILYLWLIPYMGVTAVVFYDSISEKSKVVSAENTTEE